MSERLKEAPNKHEKLMLPSPEDAEPLRAGEEAPKVEKAPEHEITAEEARADVAETVAETKAEDPLEDLKKSEVAPEVAPVPVDRKLAVQRQLSRVQSRLKSPQRAFSKVVHQPVVRTVSEITSKSLSRPSGLLGGGLLAFIGTSGYLYLSRHIGFTYNYFVVLLLLLGGFALGVILELLVYLATTSKRSRD